MDWSFLTGRKKLIMHQLLMLLDGYNSTEYSSKLRRLVDSDEEEDYHKDFQKLRSKTVFCEIETSSENKSPSDPDHLIKDCDPHERNLKQTQKPKPLETHMRSMKGLKITVWNKHMSRRQSEEELKDHAIINSGCSGSMTTDKVTKLLRFSKDYKGGYVAFGNILSKEESPRKA
ncbi:hypothetical protein Tco_1540622 [Tanacetum coccineum]